MARLPRPLGELLEQADARLVAGWYAAVSVDADRVRRQLRLHGLRYAPPRGETERSGDAPTLADLDHTAERLIARSRAQAATLGGVGGLFGGASVPPEVAGQLVATLRLAQRLAIVYGFDPATDRGQMALFQALAAAYDVPLPDRGPVGVRVSDLPALIGPTLAPRTVGLALARAMVAGSARSVTRSVLRVLPLLASLGSAAAEHRRLDQLGHTMRDVFRRLAEMPQNAPDIEEAMEVRDE